MPCCGSQPVPNHEGNPVLAGPFHRGAEADTCVVSSAVDC